MRVRAGFEPSVARVIVEDYTVSRPIDRFLFRGLYYQAQDLATRRGSNPARSNDIWMAHQQRAEIFALPLRFRSYGADPFVAGESYKDFTPTELRSRSPKTARSSTAAAGRLAPT
jgi:hypothetical protein